MPKNNSKITSLLGWLFHGCWHRYGEWSEPFRGRHSASYQEKECRKCGRVVRRTVSFGISRSGGYKPKKPTKPPQVKKTPNPPTGGTGESS